MGDKTYICTSCGRYNEKGRFILEPGDDTKWWTCTSCLLKELMEESVSGK